MFALVQLLGVPFECAWWPHAAAGEPLPTLTTARQILALTAEEADRQYPVDVRGWLTGFDSKTTITFLQDETGGVFVYAPKVPPEMKFGKRVRMRGLTGAGRFTSVLMLSEVEMLPDEQLPAARVSTLAEVQEGQLDCQWIEVEGLVTSESENWHQWMMQLAAGSETVPVRIMDFDRSNPPRLTGCRVRIRGVGGAHYDDSTWTKEFLVYCQSTNQLTILNRPEPDPFKMPLSTARSLSRFRGPWEVDRRLRLRGTVSMAWPGRFFFIHDADGPVRVEAGSGEALRPGDIVDAVGLQQSTKFTPTLAHAVYKVVGRTNPPVATLVEGGGTALARQSGHLVTLSALTAHAQHIYSDHVDYHVQAGHVLLHAVLPIAKGQAPVMVPADVYANLTGVVEVSSAAEGQGESIRLWLRSPQDIVFEHTFLLRFKRLVIAAMPVWFLCIAVGLGWIVHVRRQLTKREMAVRGCESRLSDQHRRLFEDNHDMAFTLDLQGNISSINRAGRELLELDSQSLALGRFTDYLQPDGAEVWLGHSALLLEGRPKAPCELMVRSKSGRLIALEVSAFPVLEGGRLLGFEATARDITERKEAADALRNSQRQLRQLLEERQQMARDLHDGLIQSIYAIGLSIEEGRRLIAKEPSSAEGLLGKVLSSLNTIIRDVRNFILGLEPQELRAAEFRAALKSLVLTLNDARTCRFHMHVDPACDQLDSRAATQLLLIAREAMTNIIKHAGATSATVSLRRRGATAVFEVEDDGQGFDPAVLTQRGHGLSNIESRAQELDAELTIVSKPGAGTRLVLVIPLHPSDADDSTN